ncbi:MAG TPA: DUF418 domain-containing protein [Vicinamibacterales bacterium]|nr:DUF418 domain-containing protein [Vicinamibacterales bacterium]
MSEHAPAATIGPVPALERITVIDCLRGAALLGILVANMRGFNAPLRAYEQPSLLWTWMPDRVMQAIVDWLVSGKFITIFATLFGIGFAIQMDRAVARGLGPAFYLRRMLGLLLIGALHAFGIWWGDILMTYAVCGLFLPLFRNLRQKTILIWGHILYWFINVIATGFWVVTLFSPEKPREEHGRTMQELIRIYSSGTIREIFSVRTEEWLDVNGMLIFLTRVLALFLFGLFIWRQGYLARPAEHLDWWRRAQRLGLPIGLVGNAIAVALVLVFDPNPMKLSGVTVLYFFVMSIAIPALSLGYAATVVLLWQDPAMQRRLMPFSYVGRMALTNYLTQSIVCTTIFYSYGLGLYGRVGPLADFFLALAIYALQVPLSKWWLTRYRYGPAEAAWRWMTYGAAAFRGDQAASSVKLPASS